MKTRYGIRAVTQDLGPKRTRPEVAFPLVVQRMQKVERDLRARFRVCATAGLVLTTLALTGCGKPPPPERGGPPGEMIALAVVAPAEKQTVRDEISVVASLASRDEVTVVSELDATVMAIGFVDGQAVKEGDALVTFDTTQTAAKLEEAKAGYRMAELSYERNQALLKNETISQQEYDQAETDYFNRKAALALAEDNQSKTELRAPFDGVVAEKQVSVGQFVSRGTALTHLISVNPLDAEFDVPERYVGQLQKGQVIHFSAGAFADETFEGTVVYLAPSVDPQTRTLRVKAEIANEDGRLKPGMFGSLALVLSERADALVIPEAAIQFTSQGTMVIAVNGAGISEFRPVQVGQRSKGSAEILEGLAAGELVVVEGHQKMGPGMTVHAAPESERYGVTPGPIAPATTQTGETANAGG